MLVGLTYDLKDEWKGRGYHDEEIAEMDSVVTIDAIEASLQTLGLETLRIGSIFSLVEFLASGKRCDLIFNISEGLYGLLRESQVPALLDAYQIPYVFSDSFTLAITLHKELAKAKVRASHIPTAESVLIETLSDLSGVHLPYPLFAKPVGGGTGMGITAQSRVESEAELAAVCATLLSEYEQPVLVERYLAGREFTVGITGSREDAVPVGVMEIIVDETSDGGIYSYKSKQEYLEVTRYVKAEGEAKEACQAVALASWRALGCRDGGRVDLKMDREGVPYFLEVNPLAGLHPIDSDLPILARMHGLSYDDLIARIMASAFKRMGVCIS
ncbi:MAG TPA: ATP-grasp domain-containing protein [Sphaerochaeta sp.]|jgi:D-alanine-D-alanine ligase|nr:ATP-grasp domain-containing protein [Sphaerochaeta sp.]